MNSAEKKLEFQIQTWAFIGPLAAFLTFFVLLATAPGNAYALACALIGGVAACWKWQRRGLAISLTVLSAIVFYHFLTMDWSEWFWQLGMACSLALVYVVTVLSFEEATAPVLAFAGELNAIKQEMGVNETQVANFKQLVELAREDLIQSQQRNEQLNQALVDKNHENARLQEREAAAQERLQNYQNLVHVCNDKSELLLKKEGEIVELKGQLTQIQGMVDTYALNIREKAELSEKKEREKADLQQQLSQLQSKSDTSTRELRELREKHEKNASLEQTIATLQGELALAEEQRIQELEQQQDLEAEETPFDLSSLTPEVRQVAAKYLQLREQFAEKSAILDETRRELFHSQEKLLRLQRETEESEKYAVNKTEQKLIAHILKLERELSQQEQEREALHQIIDRIQNRPMENV